MRRAKWALAASICLMVMSVAPSAAGRAMIIAHRGIYQTFDHAGIDAATCTAKHIHRPVHRFLENTIPSLREAARLGADWIEIDVSPTKDNQLVVFHDWTLDCRTNGRGDIRDHTLAELKALDIGYGYTADGGKSFPFRGVGIGLMPTLEEVLRALPRQRFLLNFKSGDPAEADAVAAAFRRADVLIDGRFAFYGGQEAVLTRMRDLAPKAWIWRNAQPCSRRFLADGWTAPVEELCRGGVVGITLDRTKSADQWADLSARVSKARARIVLFGRLNENGVPVGFERREQWSEVPRSFNGYIWVEDLWAVRRAAQQL